MARYVVDPPGNRLTKWRVPEIEQRFRQAQELFLGLKERHPGLVADVRGLGLMLAIELADIPDLGNRVFEALMDAGFLVNLSKGRILRLLPPLVIDTADLEAFAEALDGILASHAAR